MAKRELYAVLIDTYYNLSAEYKRRTEHLTMLRTECDSLYCEMTRIEKF